MKQLLCLCCLLCGLIAHAWTAGAADRQLRDGQGRSVVLRQSPDPGFFHYTNERFSFTVDVPALFSKALVVPDNGDGVILTDEAGEARFRASGGNRIDKRTLRRMFDAERRDLNDLGIQPAYEHVGKSFFVLSWVQDNEIHYRKFVFGNSVWFDMEMTYPAGRKREFDVLVGRGAASLKQIGR